MRKTKAERTKGNLCWYYYVENNLHVGRFSPVSTQGKRRFGPGNASGVQRTQGVQEEEKVKSTVINLSTNLVY